MENRRIRSLCSGCSAKVERHRLSKVVLPFTMKVIRVCDRCIKRSADASLERPASYWAYEQFKGYKGEFKGYECRTDI